MRPLQLEIEGFGAYRDRTVVDFADAELFAIVGATGHGKSTLIDAICSALYGKVPRHGQSEIAPAMTLGVNETKVSFTFDLAGAMFVATRVLRRKATGVGTTTRALRLESIAPDGTTEVLAGTASEFQERMQGLIGLDFDQFTKCVVLPQGQFAAFLHARPGERVAILSALLELGRYDQMATAARERAKVAGGRREAFAAERVRIGDVTEETVTRARAQRTALAALRADTEAAAPRDVVLSQEVVAARTDADRARAAAVALGAVHVPDEARSLARASADARTEAERATNDADSAESRAAELDAVVAALPPLETLAAAATAHADRVDVIARIANGAEIIEQRREAAEAAKSELVTAQRNEEAAQHMFEEVQHHHAHAELRTTLRKGEPCPVCEQPVTTLPPKVRTTEVTKARKALDTHRKASRAADAAARDALEELNRGDDRLTMLQERLAAIESRITAWPELAALEARREEVRTAHEAAGAARKAATSARKVAQTATTAVAEAEKALRKTEAVLQRQRDALLTAGLEPPTGDPADVAGTWDALAQWAVDARPEHEKRAAASNDLAHARAAERDALLGDLAARAEHLAVTTGTYASVAELLPALVGATSDAEHAAAAATRQLARASELDADVAASRAEEQVSAELGLLLDKRHFGQWLVDETLHELVAGASALLERLSGGQYALAVRDDGELLVIDHVNADERRSVRSLSGGETFQASLALALALSDRIATLAPDGAATLESIFLDEGFGTLDPDTLAVVAATIESLGQGGERVIGVVTHVSELAERMPVRFRVQKVGRSALVTREES